MLISVDWDCYFFSFSESQVALEFTINPTTPRVMSELIVVGPEAKKRAYQNRVDEAVDTW